MSKHLRATEIKSIVSMLDGWKERLSWDVLSAACAERIGRAPSRQTLFRAQEVAVAFKAAKQRLATQQPAPAPVRELSLQAAMERIERLSAENLRLEETKNMLLEQFIRWQYNAYAHGVPVEKLDAPLPEVDHGSTEKRPRGVKK